MSEKKKEYTLNIEWSKEYECYTASYPEWKLLKIHGETQEEALKELNIVFKAVTDCTYTARKEILE